MSEDPNCYWPIIYVRGYAMSRSEIDDTTADPFCGFNIGATVMRARPDKNEPPKKFIFEGPVVRLQSDFGYEDIYEDGVDIVDPDWKGGVKTKSIVIYRFYDEASTLLGAGKTQAVEDFAAGLSKLILSLRDRVCELPENAMTPDKFHCYLVAHSMGGLVCRAFLQNAKNGSDVARKCVEKFFTYATPHNGIDMGGVNVPDWLTKDDISNFNRDRMAEFLDLQGAYKRTGRVDWMPEETFPSDHIFCMVGTNRGDYEAAAGLSRTFAGRGSDGLVRIENASVWGVNAQGATSVPSATAYAYRAHSGRYGIVNSEEAYQNLARFLFGDVRIDCWVDIDDVYVPQELENDDKAGKLDALYQIEFLASPRGKRWFLTRRTAEEDSVACRSHSELRDPAKPEKRRVYLSTAFLANRYRVDPKRATLAYGVTLGIRVPDYEIEKRFWPNRHYEGEYLFRDSLALEMKPPTAAGGDWELCYDWQSDNVGQSTTPIAEKSLKGGKVEATVKFATSDKTPPRSPGIAGKLRFVISLWNQSNRGESSSDANGPAAPTDPGPRVRTGVRARKAAPSRGRTLDR
jgi:hypothetical protein